MCSLDGNTLSGVGSVVGGVGDLLAGTGEAKAHRKRMGRIMESTRDQLNQMDKAQSRRRGAQRAAYGKAGVKLTGSAKRLMEEQLKEDELELLKTKYNAQLKIDDAKDSAKSAINQGLMGLGQGIFDAVSTFTGGMGGGASSG